DGDVQYLRTDPGRVKCYRYDVVLNGFEIGGGSIRLHDPRVQAEVFIAMGMDRLAMLLSGAESLRDVIPFPKTKTGIDSMTGAPGEVDDHQLRELHVRSAPPPKS